MGYRSLEKTESMIALLGMTELVLWLMDTAQGDAVGEKVLNFESERAVARAQRVLYQWLFFHPGIKNRVSLSIQGLELTIKFRRYSERRGRKGMK